MSTDIIEAEITRPTIFKDEKKLTAAYLPDFLPFREEQMKALTNYFKGIILHPNEFTQNVIIHGEIGTGKTVLAKKFGLNFEQIAQKYDVPLKYVHVNCRKKQTPFLVLLSVIHELNLHFPSRGFSAEDLAEVLVKELEQQEISLLLCLDEVDFLVFKKGANLLYSLVRTLDDQLERKCCISLILIIRNTVYRKFLNAIPISPVRLNTIHLEKYSVTQLQEILKMRVNEALYQGTISDEATQLIANFGGSSGDARYAIELLRRAGKTADLKNTKKILPEHVKAAWMSIHPVIQSERLNDLSFHHLLFLLAVTQNLVDNKTQAVSIKDAEAIYAEICPKYNTRPRKHTQIWQYVQDLCSLELLCTKVTSQGIRGRTTFINLGDISPTVLEREITQALSKKREE